MLFGEIMVFAYSVDFHPCSGFDGHLRGKWLKVAWRTIFGEWAVVVPVVVVVVMVNVVVIVFGFFALAIRVVVKWPAE